MSALQSHSSVVYNSNIKSDLRSSSEASLLTTEHHSIENCNDISLEDECTQSEMAETTDTSIKILFIFLKKC